MNLFHCNLHAEGYGNWRHLELYLPRNPNDYKVYHVYEIDGEVHNHVRDYYLRRFLAGEWAEGWFASELDELTDCHFVRHLSESEYDSHAYTVQRTSSYYIRLQRQGLGTIPCYLQGEDADQYKYLQSHFSSSEKWLQQWNNFIGPINHRLFEAEKQLTVVAQ